MTGEDRMAIGTGITPTREKLIDSGNRARAAKIELTSFAYEAQERAIAALVAAYRNRGLTYEFCVGKVGEIVALRDLLATLEGLETQGNVVKEKLYG